MTTEYCWSCGQGYRRDEVFDIPVFKQGWTVKWCFNCAMEQLKWTDYRLIKVPENYKGKKLHIKNLEDEGEEYRKFLEELQMCYEHQFRKLSNIDDVWGELHYIAQEQEYNI